jgi:small subunit ribosomal protein SAe
MPVTGKRKGVSKRLRSQRRRGRQAPPEGLANLLKPSQNDILKLLAAQTHIGRRRCHINMSRYVWKRRSDGFHIINLEKTFEKLQLAARIIVTVQNPNDVMVISSRTYGQRGAIKFATYTGAKSMVGKWTPGTFTNPQNKIYEEPRLLIVDDAATCFLALKETSYVGIPVIAFCGVHNNTRFVDCSIPCNNRGRHSIGLMFWLLAREVLRMRGEITRNEEWIVPVDLFFYRDANKVAASQEKTKRLEQEQQQQQQSYLNTQYYQPETYKADTTGYNVTGTGAADEQQDQYDAYGAQDYDQPPQDDLWGTQQQQNIDQGAYNYNQQPPPPVQAPAQPQYYGQPPQQQQDYDENAQYGGGMQEW